MSVIEKVTTPSALLTVSEAARWAQVSESFLNKARVTGGGPTFLRLGRSIRYRVEDLQSWAVSRPAGSTSEYVEQRHSRATSRSQDAVYLLSAAELAIARLEELSGYLRETTHNRRMYPLEGVDDDLNFIRRVVAIAKAEAGS